MQDVISVASWVDRNKQNKQQKRKFLPTSLRILPLSHLACISFQQGNEDALQSICSKHTRVASCLLIHTGTSSIMENTEKSPSKKPVYTSSVLHLIWQSRVRTISYPSRPESYKIVESSDEMQNLCWFLLLPWGTHRAQLLQDPRAGSAWGYKHYHCLYCRYSINYLQHVFSQLHIPLSLE